MLCESHMHLRPTQLPFLPHKQTTTTSIENISSSHRGNCSVSQCVPLYIPLSTHLPLQMFNVTRHRSGSRSLASVTPSVLDPQNSSSRPVIRILRAGPLQFRARHQGGMNEGLSSALSPTDRLIGEQHCWGWGWRWGCLFLNRNFSYFLILNCIKC